jgi:hypothetical protein
MNQSDDNTKFNNIAWAVNYTGLCANTIRTRCSPKWQGLKFPHFRIGNRLKFRKVDVDSYMAFFEGMPATKPGEKGDREPVTGVHD